MGTRLLDTCATPGDGASFDEVWLCLAVPTVVSEPETDFASSSSSKGWAATMPRLAASEGWCDLLVGMDDDAAAAARITLPLPSVLVEAPETEARGMAFMVATRGMRLDSDADLDGEAVRLPTLGLEAATPGVPMVLAVREGVCEIVAACSLGWGSEGFAALRGSSATLFSASAAVLAEAPRLRAGDTCSPADERDSVGSDCKCALLAAAALG